MTGNILVEHPHTRPRSDIASLKRYASLPKIRVARRVHLHTTWKEANRPHHCLVHSTNRPYCAATPQSQRAFGADSIAAESSSRAGYFHCSSPRLDPPFSQPPLRENCTPPCCECGEVDLLPVSVRTTMSNCANTHIIRNGLSRCTKAFLTTMTPTKITRQVSQSFCTPKI